MRRSVVALGTVAAVVVGALTYFRRGASRRRERVDLYYADGSMVSLGEESHDAERLLTLGRDVVRAAH